MKGAKQLGDFHIGERGFSLLGRGSRCARLQERTRPLRVCEFHAVEFGDIEPDEPLGSFSLLRGQLTLGDDARYQLLLRAIVLRMDRCLHAICRKNDSEALIIYGKEFLQH